MKLGTTEVIIGISTLVLVVFGMLFQFTGVLTILSLFILFYVPLYFVVNALDIEPDEKIFLPFFLGIGIIPTVVYWLGIIIPFRISMGIVVVALTVGGYLIYHKKNKHV